jgi:small conductance mechanosensitive channel
MDNVVNQLTFFVTTYGIKVIGAIIILILGRITAGIGQKTVKKVLEKSKTDPAVLWYQTVNSSGTPSRTFPPLTPEG